MYVKHVESNVKRGANAILAPVTLVVGGNGSGKSSLVQSLRLGLTGKLEGEVASNADLFLLHPSGEGTLKVALTLAEEDVPDQLNVWEVTGSTSKSSRPRWVDGLPRGAIVSDVVRALLGKNARQLREALLTACAPKDAVKAAARILPEATVGLFNDTVTTARAEASDALDADVLVTALATLKKKLRDGRKIVKAAQSGDSLPPPPNPDAVARARAEAARLVAIYTVQQRHAVAVVRIEQLTTQLASMPADAPAMSLAEISAATARVKAAKLLRDRLIEKQSTSCFTCGGAVTPAGLLAAGESQTRALESIQSLTPRASAGRSRGDTSDELAVVSRQLAEDAEYLQGAGDLSALTENLSAAREALVNLEADGRAHEAALAARSRAQAVSAELDSLGGLVKTLERSVKEQLFDALASFEERASAALPAGYLIRIQLYDGERQIAPRVLLGWTENDAPVWRALSAISGSQRALVIAAIAQAWASECPEPVRLLVIDEVWMQPAMVEALLTALVTVIGKSSVGLTQAVVCVCDYDGPPVPGAVRVRVG